jgi:hypothetical protein
LSCDLLSGCAFDGLQELAEQMMPETAQVYRRTLTPDSTGAKAESYIFNGTTVCAIEFPDGKPNVIDAVVGGRITAKQRLLLAVPLDADVVQTDRLTINNVSYDVISLVVAESYAVEKRILVTPTL